jgi:hypothetical protein
VSRIGIAAALVTALVLGGIWFPRDADPGRADASGYALNTFVTPETNAADWFPSSARRITRRADGGLHVVTGAGTQLLSRPLAVFARRCYLATVDIASHGDIRFEVTDEDLTRLVRQLQLSAGNRSAHRLYVESGALHRLSLVFWSRAGNSFTLYGATLRPSNGCKR